MKGSMPPESPPPAPKPATSGPPRAVVVPVRRMSWAWLLPLLAALFAAFLGWRTWVERGLLITVRAAEGHGIKAGDPAKYLGIAVGVVEDVGLSDAFDEVFLRVRLEPSAASFARAGTRFWIVRPHLALDGVQGLETIVGARYLALDPRAGVEAGPGESQREFVALAEPPIPERIEAEGLEILLEAPARLGLAPGAALGYRDIRIGTVLAVGLASDGTSVEVRAYIRPAYTQLIRTNTRFFETGGLDIQLALLGGLRVEMDSVRSLLVGSISVATPDAAAEIAGNGHRFVLHSKVEEEWLDWRPALPVGSDLLPSGAPIPEPLRAHLKWREGRIFKRGDSQHGWLLPVAGGLLGAADLLRPGADANGDTPLLEIEGTRLPLDTPPQWEAAGLAQIAVELALPGQTADWPTTRLRRPTAPEDCLVLAAATLPTRALSAARLAPADDGESWRVDGALAFDGDWHGACVVARADGMLLGFLLVDRRGRARVALLPTRALSR